MAATITHIVCALSLLNNNALEVDNIKNFIIGTTFPDIRYLKVIQRKSTHIKNVRWTDIEKAVGSFEKGLLLHSRLDEVREAYIVERNLYAFIPNSPFRGHVLKFYEDILLYEMIDDWSKIADYFDTILAEEIKFNIKEEDIQTWHLLLKHYVSQKPNVSQIMEFLQEYTNIALQAEKNMFKRFFLQCKAIVINRIAYFKLRSMINNLKKNQEITDAIKFFYENIDTFLTRTPSNSI